MCGIIRSPCLHYYYFHCISFQVQEIWFSYFISNLGHCFFTGTCEATRPPMSTGGPHRLPSMGGGGHHLARSPRLHLHLRLANTYTHKGRPPCEAAQTKSTSTSASTFTFTWGSLTRLFYQGSEQLPFFTRDRHMDIFIDLIYFSELQIICPAN